VKKVRYLVTGGAGYKGIPLTEHLLEKGNKVVCLDRYFFGEEPLEKIRKNKNFTSIQDDIRWFDPKILENVDVVIDLAALSNDPSGELNPSKTLDINYLGRVRVAKLSKEYGVKRYIFASSCSVYGFNTEILDEKSDTNPLTTYAKSAVMGEKDVLHLADKDYTVTCLRFATVYGLSPRMRFDLAINAMSLILYRTGKIMVMRDGKQWRPFIHVRDVARAYETVSTADPEIVNGQILNVGSNEQNYQIYPLAEELGESLGKPYAIEWYGDPDKRSYRVNFDKITNNLDFHIKYTPNDAAKEIYKAIDEHRVDDNIRTKTVEWYKYLTESEKLLKKLMIKDTIL
jgi:nucleoside-diphosphate-sugar epimerase